MCIVYLQVDLHCSQIQKAIDWHQSVKLFQNDAECFRVNFCHVGNKPAAVLYDALYGTSTSWWSYILDYLRPDEHCVSFQ